MTFMKGMLESLKRGEIEIKDEIEIPRMINAYNAQSKLTCRF